MKFLRRHAVYGLLAPFFLFFAFFWVAPLLEGLRMSFFSNEIFGEASFVGGDNYREI
ncbi:MAG TPA: sugar ABC transporter permease, partial [Verrucomicrobiales bacterium]|nr:sugar ABC transporter permease [Verrucomicrobiales bacterium]